MSRHLQTKCSQCEQSVDKWREIIAFANQEGRFMPPEESVEAVIDAFAANPVMRSPTTEMGLALLVSDSFRQRPAFGMRGTSASGRQVLYKYGTISVDVRLQSTPGSPLVLLVGQLLDSSKPNHSVGEIPVVLLSKGVVVSQKHTNDMGEFDFGFDQLPHGQLVFGLDDQHKLVVPVPD